MENSLSVTENTLLISVIMSFSSSFFTADCTELAERSIREAEPPSRRRQNGQVRLLGLLVMIGFLLIAIILLIAM